MAGNEPDFVGNLTVMAPCVEGCGGAFRTLKDNNYDGNPGTSGGPVAPGNPLGPDGFNSGSSSGGSYNASGYEGGVNPGGGAPAPPCCPSNIAGQPGAGGCTSGGATGQGAPGVATNIPRGGSGVVTPGPMDCIFPINLNISPWSITTTDGVSTQVVGSSTQGNGWGLDATPSYFIVVVPMNSALGAHGIGQIDTGPYFCLGSFNVVDSNVDVGPGPGCGGC